MARLLTPFLSIALSAGLLSVAGVSCTRITATYINNPLTAGKVQENRVRVRRHGIENRFDLAPRTLDQTAMLASLDDKEICFDLTLRAPEQRSDEATPDGWSFELQGEPQFNPSGVTVQASKKLPSKSVSGTLESSSKSTQRNCREGEKDCRTKETKTVVREPAQIKVLSTESRLCFNHAGGVTKDTNFVQLQARSNERPGELDLNFKWYLE